MVKGDFMISHGLTTYLKKVLGIFIILISLSSNLGAVDKTINNYIKLGEEFNKSGQSFLSYQNYASAFILEEDRERSLELGLKALTPCFKLNRVNEGSWLINELSKIEYNPDYYNTLLALLFLKDHNLKKTQSILEQITNRDNSKVKLLSSYYGFLTEDYNSSLVELNNISMTFPGKHILMDISNELKNPPVIIEKSPILSVGLSAIIPGAGQIYSGLMFDGINALLINGLLGSTSAALWYYESEKDYKDRNFSLPVVSTVAFSIFYITNLYNAYNSANRYNSFKQNRYYNGIFEKFQLLIDDDSLFIGYIEDF